MEVALELEKQALADDYFVSRKLFPNVDFYSGLIYNAMGFPTDMFPGNYILKIILTKKRTDFDFQMIKFKKKSDWLILLWCQYSLVLHSSCCRMACTLGRSTSRSQWEQNLSSSSSKIIKSNILWILFAENIMETMFLTKTHTPFFLDI
jgi:hypothetical protein